jgi:hypothetical protein
MTKRHLLALCPIAFALSLSMAHAQDVPAATQGGQLRVGLAVSLNNTDYATKKTTGGTVFANFAFTDRFGVEADIHYLNGITPEDFGENSYVIGPRFAYRVHGRYSPYVKVMAGIGSTVADEPYVKRTGSVPGSYGIFAFGGGLDIDIPHNLTVRAIDFELQRWPGFEPNGLSPTVISIGIAYRIR